MSCLTGVRRFGIPRELIDCTLDSLQYTGAEGYEAFVLWGGRLENSGTSFQFSDAYFPAQTTTASDDGLLVVVSGEALHRVNRAFYERGLILAGQVHSHPTDAYHSDTDDVYPMMTLVGGLSGVVPEFGRGGYDDLHRWAWYRLSGLGEWEPVDGETTITVGG